MVTTAVPVDDAILEVMQTSAVGPENAITSDVISTRAGLPITRENVAVRDAIRRLRLLGYPIMASNSDLKGYYLATDVADIARFRASILGRVESLSVLLETLDGMIANFPGPYDHN